MKLVHFLENYKVSYLDVYDFEILITVTDTLCIQTVSLKGREPTTTYYIVSNNMLYFVLASLKITPVITGAMECRDKGGSTFLATTVHFTRSLWAKKPTFL